MRHNFRMTWGQSEDEADNEIQDGITAGRGSVRAKIESSEVMLGPFISASSSRLDPCSTCSRCFPCGDAARDLRSGSGLTANRINLPNASELYPAFDFASRSPRPALGYRPLLTLLFYILQCEKVIALET